MPTAATTATPGGPTAIFDTRRHPDDGASHLDNPPLIAYPQGMTTNPTQKHTTRAAAKLRWAAAQQHHGLRGTPSHEMTTGTKHHLGAKPLGPSTTSVHPLGGSTTTVSE